MSVWIKPRIFKKTYEVVWNKICLSWIRTGCEQGIWQLPLLPLLSGQYQDDPVRSGGAGQARILVVGAYTSLDALVPAEQSPARSVWSLPAQPTGFPAGTRVNTFCISSLFSDFLPDFPKLCFANLCNTGLSGPLYSRVTYLWVVHLFCFRDMNFSSEDYQFESLLDSYDYELGLLWSDWGFCSATPNQHMQWVV